MRIAILQPSYIPWIGVFHMICETDIFIYLNDVQWTKNDWRNRNRIRTPQGWTWLTIPVYMDKPRMETKICEVRLNNSLDWKKSHLSSLQSCYKKSPYFKEIYALVEDELETPYIYIGEFSTQLISRICRYLGIRTKFYISSQLNWDRSGIKTDKLLWFLRYFGADTYISGPTAKGYLDEIRLKNEGIQVEWHDYQPPYYNQNRWRTDTFISYLSILDLLFHHGKESYAILTKKKIIELPEGVKILTPEEYKK